MKTPSHFLTAAVLIASTTVGSAQPGSDAAPADPAQPAQPGQPAQPAPPADPAQPAQPEAPAQVVEPVTAVVAPDPEPKKKDDKPAVTAKYDGGLKFSTEDGGYGLKVSFRNQMRFEANRPLEDGAQFTDRFYVPRTRFQAEGHLFGKGNRFKVELGLGDSGSFSVLKDGWLEKKVAEEVYLRFGQWKRPFNRPEIVSDFGSTFNERAIQNDLAGGGRDVGVALHNEYEKSPEGLEWVIGVFNGFSGGKDRPVITTACTEDAAMMSITCVNSKPSNFPRDFGPTIVARAGYNSPKMKGYSEGDLEGGPLRYAVGAAYKIDLANFDGGKQDGWSENISHGLEADALIKAMGFSVHAAVVMMKLKSGDPDFGVMVQPGMMIVPKKVEVGARFALVTDKAADRQQIEGRLALSHFWHGHTWKVATDGGFLKFIGDGSMDDKPDLQFRVMMQLQI